MKIVKDMLANILEEPQIVEIHFMLQRLNRFGLSLEHIFLYGIMDIKVLISRCDTRALTKIVRKQWKRKSRSLKMISDCMIKTSTTM